MRNTFILLLIIFASCESKTSLVNESIVTLEDGFYIVSKTGNSEQELMPLKNTERIITYNKEFLDPEDDKFLVIDAADFVPLSLKEKPTTEVQKDKTQNFYLALNDFAKSKLEQFTTLNLYKTTAIVVNGEAYTKHQIKSIIDGGYLQITQCSENTCRMLYDQFDDNIIGLPSNLDWANLQRFAKANKELEKPKKNENRVVFIGNSITEGWSDEKLVFFNNPNYINRGISGQTTPQMLIRFRSDVIELRPKVVVILAGINDIAENTGPISIETIAGNIISMIELARANDIEVVLCSTLPAFDLPWRPGLNPSGKVIRLNQLLKEYAVLKNIVYVDYFSAMVDDRNGLNSEFTNDEVHPTIEGYKTMEPLVEEGIKKAFAKK